VEPLRSMVSLGEEREETMLREEIKTRRFNVEEYHRMGEVGILGEDDRVELVGGELVEMAPIGSPHLSCVVGLTHLLVEAASGRWFVSVQNPIRLGERDEPEPDLSLLKAKPDPESQGPPTPEDVLLVVEVSDTTLSYDRNVKLPLYARAAIPEVWIVDLNGRVVEIHSNASSDGYRGSRSFGPGERIISDTVEGLSISVEEALG
jgi:Uma2 family endonuclease